MKERKRKKLEINTRGLIFRLRPFGELENVRLCLFDIFSLP
jgi:hypothetical protein